MTFAVPPAEIMVIDDRADTRHALMSLLAQAGHAVAEAAHVGQALAYLRHFPRPRLILLRLRLAAGGGWRFLGLRHADPAVAAIPVVGLGAGGPSLRSPALALGADDFLDRPADAREVLAVVRRYCPPGA